MKYYTPFELKETPYREVQRILYILRCRSFVISTQRATAPKTELIEEILRIQDVILRRQTEDSDNFADCDTTVTEETETTTDTEEIAADVPAPESLPSEFTPIPCTSPMVFNSETPILPDPDCAKYIASPILFNPEIPVLSDPDCVKFIDKPSFDHIQSGIKAEIANQSANLRAALANINISVFKETSDFEVLPQTWKNYTIENPNAENQKDQFVHGFKSPGKHSAISQFKLVYAESGNNKDLILVERSDKTAKTVGRIERSSDGSYYSIYYTGDDGLVIERLP